MDEQRKKFEEWCNGLGVACTLINGEYVREDIKDCWCAWQAALEAAKPKWVSVDDELPSDDFDSKEYIVFEALNGKVQHDYYMVPDDGSEPFWNHYGKYVTHWMEMPKPVPQVV